MSEPIVYSFKVTGTMNVDSDLVPLLDSEGGVCGFKNPKTKEQFQLVCGIERMDVHGCYSCRAGSSFSDLGFEVQDYDYTDFELQDDAILTDSRGKMLTVKQVRNIAERNAKASSDQVDENATSHDLLQWATDAEGAFDDAQVSFLGYSYWTE